MTIATPIVLFGWMPFAVSTFFFLKSHRAILCTIIGGWLLLPMAAYDVPGIPPFTKGTAIAISLVIGSILSRERSLALAQWQIYDTPMLIYCLAPIATSLSNDLGLYDGLSGVCSQIVIWGIPYLAGRIYFRDSDELRDLCIGIIIGGLLYVPLCLYEVRMSPQLSNILYGFFPHSFAQHMRYGGFRPIVFMQHGLMVALWMALSSTVAYWFWREKEVNRISGFFLSMPVLVGSLVVTTIFCKSVNGLFVLFSGFFLYHLFKHFKSNYPILLLLFLIPVYIGLRATDSVPVDTIDFFARSFLNDERAESLIVRLTQENLFNQKTWEQPLFGWGGYLRGWPIDPDTGEKLINMIDSTWLITFNTFGLVGLTSLFFAMLQGPWKTLRFTASRIKNETPMVPILLSLVIIQFMIDSLFNGMVNPVYILSSGAIMSWYLKRKKELSVEFFSENIQIKQLHRKNGGKILSKPKK